MTRPRAACGCSASEAKKRPTIGDGRDVYRVMRPYAEHEVQECIWVLAVDVHAHLRGEPVEVARGQQARVAVDMPDLLRPVIVLGCIDFVFCHNHPSGSLEYSESDRDLTESAERAAACAGLYLLDHVILAYPTGWYSFREDRTGS